MREQAEDEDKAERAAPKRGPLLERGAGRHSNQACFGVEEAYKGVVVASVQIVPSSFLDQMRWGHADQGSSNNGTDH